ncbi:MAG: hypothetical protein ACR2GR_02745, partial [Rhodothermales bacterium]
RLPLHAPGRRLHADEAARAAEVEGSRSGRWRGRRPVVPIRADVRPPAVADEESRRRTLPVDAASKPG